VNNAVYLRRFVVSLIRRNGKAQSRDDIKT